MLDTVSKSEHFQSLPMFAFTKLKAIDLSKSLSNLAFSNFDNKTFFLSSFRFLKFSNVFCKNDPEMAFFEEASFVDESFVKAVFSVDFLINHSMRFYKFLVELILRI